MKKIIITLSVAGFISLGFTVVGSNKSSKEEKVGVEQSATSANHSRLSDSNDKRLATWD